MRWPWQQRTSPTAFRRVPDDVVERRLREDDERRARRAFSDPMVEHRSFHDPSRNIVNAPSRKGHVYGLPIGVDVDCEAYIKLVGIEWKSSRSSGNPYLSLEYVITDCEVERLIGHRIWDACSASPQAMWRMQEVISAVLSPLNHGQKEFRVHLVTEEYMGTPRLRLHRYLKANTGATLAEEPFEL